MLVTFDSRSGGKGEKANGRSNSKDGGKETPKSTTQEKSNFDGSYVKVIEDSTDLVSNGMGRRSKNGCLTCKIRKKKCNEQQPICSDCERLGKDCVWVDYDTMDEEEIRKLRTYVLEYENNSKLRKRKAKEDKICVKKTSTHSCSNIKPKYSSIHETSTFDAETSKVIKNVKFDLNDLKTIPNSIVDGARYMNLKRENESKYGKFGELCYWPSKSTSVATASSIEDSGNNSPWRERLSDSDEFRKLEELIAELGPGFKSGFKSRDELLMRSFYKLIEDDSQIHEPFEMGSNFQGIIKETLELTTISPQRSPKFTCPIISPPIDLFQPLPLTSQSSAFLFRYFFEVLSSKVSVVPVSHDHFNSYSRVFMPLAYQDEAVFYSILAWSSYHIGGVWKEEGKKYISIAMDRLGITNNNSIHFNGSRSEAVLKLSALLILCAAEICSSDVKKWTKYLHLGWHVIRSAGGISNFNTTRLEYWLSCSFAYHDLLASSTSERGSYFPLDDYDELFKDTKGVSGGKLHPLLGISKDLYRIIGDINNLYLESNNILKDYNESSNDEKNDTKIISTCFPSSNYIIDDITPPQGDYSEILRKIISKAEILDKRVDSLKPREEDICTLNNEELELQLTLFEAFQISVKLLLRQTIFKINPSNLINQILCNDLNKCIDILLESPAQASLVFPVFIAGIHCVGTRERSLMTKRLEKFISLYGEWNVILIKQVIEIVWESNPKGDAVINWFQILKDLDWELNFA